MKCEKCNNEHNGLYGSGRFCSSKCARMFSASVNRKETNRKISETLKNKGIKPPLYSILTKEQKKQRKEKTKETWLRRKLDGKGKKFSDLKSFSTIRIRIFEKRGRKCEKCGWAEKNKYNGFIPVQIDHKDGNKKNNKDDNLIILCPNCHSLTKYFMFYGRKRGQ